MSSNWTSSTILLAAALIPPLGGGSCGCSGRGAGVEGEDGTSTGSISTYNASCTIAIVNLNIKKSDSAYYENTERFVHAGYLSHLKLYLISNFSYFYLFYLIYSIIKLIHVCNALLHTLYVSSRILMTIVTRSLKLVSVE